MWWFEPFQSITNHIHIHQLDLILIATDWYKEQTTMFSVDVTETVCSWSGVFLRIQWYMICNTFHMKNTSLIQKILQFFRGSIFSMQSGACMSRLFEKYTKYYTYHMKRWVFIQILQLYVRDCSKSERYKIAFTTIVQGLYNILYNFSWYLYKIEGYLYNVW